MLSLAYRRPAMSRLQLLQHTFLLGVFISTAVYTAPLAADDEIEAVSVFEEPNHQIIFTNDQVSVYRVDIQAKEDSHTLYHYHENDQLTVLTLKSSGFDQRLGEEAKRFDAPAGTLLFTSYSAVKAIPHRVSVPAGEQFGVVGVEFFAPPSAEMEKRLSSPADAQFETPHTTVRRLELKGEEIISTNTLLISLGNHELLIEKEGPSTSWKAGRGDIYWIEDQVNRVKISSAETAKFIVIPINRRE
jgi:hypothetical protein